MGEFSDRYAANHFYGTHMKVTKPLVFKTKDYEIVVEKGLFSDGLTGKVFSPFMKRFSKTTRAELVHDALVNSPSKVKVTMADGEVLDEISWSFAAGVYYEALLACKHPKILSKHRVAWVRFWGWINRFD